MSLPSGTELSPLHMPILILLVGSFAPVAASRLHESFRALGLHRLRVEEAKLLLNALLHSVPLKGVEEPGGDIVEEVLEELDLLDELHKHVLELRLNANAVEPCLHRDP